MCDLRKVQVGLFSNNEKIDDKRDLLSLRSHLSNSDFIKNKQLVSEIAFVTRTHITHTFQAKNCI